MSARPLVIVTTRLPPHMCGIGTYSWLSRKHWPDDSLRVEFVVMDGAADSLAFLGVDGISEFSGSPSKLAGILDSVGPADLLLHYAGRAYQRFGCPVWMPRVLSRWKRKFPNGRLMVFFHELPANPGITSRHFLPEGINRRIVRKLAALADVVVTNTEHHLAKLRDATGRGDLQCLPVGSNIEGLPQPSQPRASNEFIIFGLPFGRWQTLQWFDSEIREWHRSGRLKQIHLIGPEDKKFTPQADRLINAWPDPGIAVRHGVLRDGEVLRLLGQARFALTNVTRETWSKSTGFMACAANGCAVVRKSDAPESAPLSNTVAAKEVGKLLDSDVEVRTAGLRAWYEKNADWSVTAARLASLLERGGGL